MRHQLVQRLVVTGNIVGVEMRRRLLAVYGGECGGCRLHVGVHDEWRLAGIRVSKILVVRVVVVRRHSKRRAKHRWFYIHCIDLCWPFLSACFNYTEARRKSADLSNLFLFV